MILTLKEYLNIIDATIEKVHIVCKDTTIVVDVENEIVYNDYFSDKLQNAVVNGIGVNDYGESIVTVDY